MTDIVRSTARRVKRDMQRDMQGGSTRA